MAETLALDPSTFAPAARRRNPFAQFAEVFGGWVREYGLFRALLGVIAPPKPKALRPIGHNAVIESLIGPGVVVLALALTSASVYAISEPTILAISAAVQAGRVPDFATLLIAFVLGASGFMLDVALVTSAMRFRMHFIRREWFWAILSLVMFLICVSVEGMTFAYLMFRHTNETGFLDAGVIRFMQDLPGKLFFIRAFMGPVCMGYLTAGVLPIVISRADIDHQVASQAGMAVVSLVQRLTTFQDIPDMRTGVSLMSLLLALLRVSTKDGASHATADQALTQAMQDLHGSSAPGRRDQFEEVFRQIADTRAMIDLALQQPPPPPITVASATELPELASVQTSMAPPPPPAMLAPRPGTTAFRRALKRVTQELITAHQTVTLYVLSQRLSASAADIQTDIRYLIEEATGKLKPRQSITDPVLVTLGGLLEPVTVH